MLAAKSCRAPGFELRAVDAADQTQYAVCHRIADTSEETAAQVALAFVVGYWSERSLDTGCTTALRASRRASLPRSSPGSLHRAEYAHSERRGEVVDPFGICPVPRKALIVRVPPGEISYRLPKAMVERDLRPPGKYSAGDADIQPSARWIIRGRWEDDRRG